MNQFEGKFARFVEVVGVGFVRGFLIGCVVFVERERV